MISKEQQIDRECVSMRNFLRNVYRTNEGIHELARTLIECGVFEELPCEPGAIELHNFGIRKMESLGMLDGESLLELLRWMLSHEWKQPID